MSWSLIESDPGVFTELINGLGCFDVQVEEIYELEETNFSLLKPIYGLIFLFKWEPTVENKSCLVKTEEIYFAKQMINNACATQALISILFNIENIELGDFLSNFKIFTKDFTPELKGLALENEFIRSVHNGFSSQSFMFSNEIKDLQSNEEVFHFIAYVPVKGHVYEIDGLQSSPIDLGEFQSDWVDVARSQINKRIQKSQHNSIKYNLMAVVQNRKKQYLALVENFLKEKKNEKIIISLNELYEKIEYEEKKRAQYKKDNELRKHNYIPFIVTLLKCIFENKKY